MTWELPVGVAFWDGGVPPPQAATALSARSKQNETNTNQADLCSTHLFLVSERARPEMAKTISGIEGVIGAGRLETGRNTDPEPVVIMVRFADAVAPLGVI